MNQEVSFDSNSANPEDSAPLPIGDQAQEESAAGEDAADLRVVLDSSEAAEESDEPVISLEISEAPEGEVDSHSLGTENGLGVASLLDLGTAGAESDNEKAAPAVSGLSVFKMRLLSFLTCRGEKPVNKFKMAASLGVGLGLGYLIFEPMLQPALVELFKYSPAIATGVGGAAALALVLRKYPIRTRKGALRDAGFGVGLGLLTLLLIYNNTATWVVETQMSAAMSPEPLSQLPVTNNQRMLPRVTAYEYSRNASHDTRLGVESNKPHLIQELNADGTRSLWWQSALHFQKGFWNYPSIALGSVDRVVRINASEKDMIADNSAGQDARFLIGGQSWATNLIFRWSHPFSTPGEVVYWRKPDGNWVMLLSYINYRPTWTGTMIPKLGGVMEFNHLGFAHNVSPKRAAKLYNGAVLYPPELARNYAEAYAHWHAGLLNVLVDHYGIDEISEDYNPVAQNQMPYVQGFKGNSAISGLSEVVLTEPVGDQNFALSEILFFDTVTGKAHSWKPGKTDSINGPRRAALNVVGSDPEINWNNYHSVESRLAVSHDRELYYLFTIVRDDGNNHTIAKFVVVKATSLKAFAFSSREEIQQFLTAGTVPDSAANLTGGALNAPAIPSVAQ
jgi:hypothetical protein